MLDRTTKYCTKHNKIYRIGLGCEECLEPLKPQVVKTDIGSSDVKNDIKPQVYDDTPLTC